LIAPPPAKPRNWRLTALPPTGRVSFSPLGLTKISETPCRSSVAIERNSATTARLRRAQCHRLETSTAERIAAARHSGVVFTLWADESGFDQQWLGSYDSVVADAIREDYEAILDYLRREARA
jgi:hypothetical protein